MGYKRIIHGSLSVSLRKMVVGAWLNVLVMQFPIIFHFNWWLFNLASQTCVACKFTHVYSLNSLYRQPSSCTSKYLVCATLGRGLFESKVLWWILLMEEILHLLILGAGSLLQTCRLDVTNFGSNNLRWIKPVHSAHMPCAAKKNVMRVKMHCQDFWPLLGDSRHGDKENNT